ncbi:retropepsin-like aspartic protease [uncultured Draconibacterium sp.]|uniref:retropepsin-like aspartic protease n=1 Tax=uncultured Draconibacterium sp. TaxID=1573823 RepID=UPI003217000C
MRYKIPIEIIHLEADNYHLIASANFTDGTRGKFVIDTGASKTVFDKNLADYFDIDEHETEELHSAGINDEPLVTSIGYIRPFSFGKMKIENLKVALLDMAHINDLYSRAAGISVCGLIGSDFLLKYQAVIDYRRKRMVLNFSR